MQPTFFDPRLAFETAARYAEPAATVATGLASEPFAGWWGMITGNPSNVEKAHHALTYTPRTESGMEGLSGLGHLLSGAGQRIMDTPYLGASVRNFGESRDALIDAGYPGLAAALQTAPVAAALAFPGTEGMNLLNRSASGVGQFAKAAGKEIAKGPSSMIPMNAQKGYLNPSVMVPRAAKAAAKVTRAGKAAAATVAGERAAQRIGSGLERSHQIYTAEKAAGSNHEGRDLFAKH